jgi:hypothetical protein
MSVEGQSIAGLLWELPSDGVLPPLLQPDDACKDSSPHPTSEHTTRPTSDYPDASETMIDSGVMEGFADVVVNIEDSDEDEEVDPLLLFSPFKRRNVLYFHSSDESGDDDEDDVDADTSKLDKTVGDHPEDDLDDGSFIVKEGSLSAESSHHGSSVQSGDPSSDGNEFTRMLIQKYVLDKKDDPIDADDAGMDTSIDGSGSEDGDDEEGADASGYYSKTSEENDEWMTTILNKRKRRCRLPRTVVVTGKRNNTGLRKASKKSDRKFDLEDTSDSSDE